MYDKLLLIYINDNIDDDDDGGGSSGDDDDDLRGYFNDVLQRN